MKDPGKREEGFAKLSEKLNIDLHQDEKVRPAYGGAYKQPFAYQPTSAMPIQ